MLIVGIFVVVFFFTKFRTVGIVLRNLEIISGDVILTLDEDSFPKSKTSVTAASSAKEPRKDSQLLAALTKLSPSFPEMVRWLNFFFIKLVAGNI